MTFTFQGHLLACEIISVRQFVLILSVDQFDLALGLSIWEYGLWIILLLLYNELFCSASYANFALQ